MNNVQFEECKVCGRPKRYVQFVNTKDGMKEVLRCIYKCETKKDSEKARHVILRNN